MPVKNPCVFVKVKGTDNQDATNLIQTVLNKQDKYACMRNIVKFIEGIEIGAFDEKVFQVSVTEDNADFATYAAFNGPKTIKGGVGTITLATVNDGFGTANSPSGYALQAASTITDAGTSVVTGNLGLSPGTSVTGFPPSTISGTQNIANAQAAAMKVQAIAIYDYIEGLAGGTDESGVDLGTLTLAPGTYFFTSSAQLTGTLTLDAGGDANAQWFFQIGTTLTTAASAVVSIINGGTAGNVFWQVGSSATLGASNAFKGNIFAYASITLGSSTTVVGRLTALNGAITLAGNTVTTLNATVSASPVGTLMNAGLGIGTILFGTGLNTMAELVSAWNTTYPTNLVTISAGGTLIPTSGYVMALTGGGVGVPASFTSSSATLQDYIATLAVLADQAGTANNVTLTGNGTSTFQQLVTAASAGGKTYTVATGGSLIPKSGEVIPVLGGVAAVNAVVLDSVSFNL